MESFTYFAPTRLLFGPGKLNELGDQELPGKRALLVTTGGKSVKANGYLARVEAQLDRAGVEHVLFDRIEPNPLRDTVNAGGRMARVEHCDFVLALGGGSVMDACKGICVVAANPGRDVEGNEVAGDIWDYVMGGTAKGLPIPNDPLPLVCVTTTAGTGSEVDAEPCFLARRPTRSFVWAILACFQAFRWSIPELMLTVLRTSRLSRGSMPCSTAWSAISTMRTLPWAISFAVKASEALLWRFPPACMTGLTSMRARSLPLPIPWAATLWFARVARAATERSTP